MNGLAAALGGSSQLGIGDRKIFNIAIEEGGPNVYAGLGYTDARHSL